MNGLTDALLFSKPNFLDSAVNGSAASNPFWLDRSEAATNDQDHDYMAEQQAFHGGLMDSFPKYTGTPGPPPAGQTTGGPVMGYYDGNAVTAQSSILRFIEDNWLDGQRIPGSFDALAGKLNGMFKFHEPGDDSPYLLDPTSGEPTN